jgi:hypothetical protein
MLRTTLIRLLSTTRRLRAKACPCQTPIPHPCNPRMKKRVNTLHLHPHLLKEVDPNVHPSQPLDQHPGDTPADQTLVAAVAVAEDHQLGVTLVMIRTWMTIQVPIIIRKWIEKGIALPLVVLLHQQDTTGASLICLAGTQIPNAYKCLANISQKCAITRLEDESMKQFGTPLAMYSDIHPSLQEHRCISKLLQQTCQCSHITVKTT